MFAKFSNFFQTFLHSDWPVLLITGGFSWWLMQHTFSSGDGELYIASKVWSDFGAHLPLIRSFSIGQNWPPEYPLFANEPIRYHFLFYWLVGMLERAGLNLGLVLNGLSAIGLTLMLWMIYRVTKLFFHRAAAGWLAIFFTLTNGSLSAILFAQKLQFSWWQLSDWLELFKAVVTAKHFASFGPWDGQIISAFWNLNILTNQRHLALSLGLVWWVVWPLLLRWQQPSQFIKAQQRRWFWPSLTARIPVIAIFPLLHQAGLMMVGWLVVGLLMINFSRLKLLQFNLLKSNLPNNKKPVDRWILGIYLIGLALAGWVAMQYVPASHQLPFWHPGFLAPDKSFLGLVTYWWFNLGLYLLIWVGALVWRQPVRWLVWLVTPLFLAANLWQFSPDIINNHKLINFFIQVLAIVAAGGWVTFWSQLKRLQAVLWWKKIIARIVLVGVLISLTFSGIVDFFPILNDFRYTVPDWENRPVAQWLRVNTPPNSVVLTTTYLYHPASLVGRKLFLDYGYFAWSLGYDDWARRVLLPKLFGQFSSVSAWCQAMQKQKLTAVVVSPGEGELGPSVLVKTSFMTTHLQPTTTTDDGYQVYLVAQYCQ